LNANILIVGLIAALALTACTRKESILSGEREGIRDALQSEAARAQVDVVSANRVLPVALPAASVNAEWRQRIGTPSTRTAHPALGRAPKLAWAVNIGAGDGKRVRITADPVVAEGRVFTLDALAQVAAVSTSGRLLWTTDLTPPDQRADSASGGGLAYGDGKLFVSAASGRLTALDPATGGVIWQQRLESTGTGTPSVFGGLVYVISGDDVAWAIDTATGRIRWQLSGTPDIHNVLGGPAPAITDKYAILAFGAGELQGAFRQGGLRLWDAQIAGERAGVASSRVADITGDPVVVGDRVFAAAIQAVSWRSILEVAIASGPPMKDRSTRSGPPATRSFWSRTAINWCGCRSRMGLGSGGKTCRSSPIADHGGRPRSSAILGQSSPVAN